MVGPDGENGVDVQPVVEVEPDRDQDLVTIQHHNMGETHVLDLQLKILIATTILVQVCVSAHKIVVAKYL